MNLVRKKKSVKVICFVFFLVIFNFNIVLGADSIMDTGKDWLKTGKQEQPKSEGVDLLAKLLDNWIPGASNSTSIDGFQDLAGVIYGIGVFVIAIVGVILGMRLMFAKPEQKAKLKEALMIYLIGSVIILGAVGIWSLLINILDGDFLY